LQEIGMYVDIKLNNIAALDACADLDDQPKMRLIDRSAITESVHYLSAHGFEASEIQACLVRYFAVDLDLLNEALRTA
jgi:hypothetical protein